MYPNLQDEVLQQKEKIQGLENEVNRQKEQNQTLMKCLV
jgi:cell division septum initiation protein DivIVA